MAVCGFTGKAFQLLQQVFQTDALILLFFHHCQNAGSGVQIYGAGEAVNDGGLSVIGVIYFRAGSYDGRDAQGSCQDGGVGGGGAFFGNEAENFSCIHLDGFTGGEVIGVEDAGFVSCKHGLLLAEGAKEDAGDFLYIADVGLHVYVSTGAVNLGEVLFRLGNGRFCVNALAADHGTDRIHKFRFRQHLLVYFENGGIIKPYTGNGFLVELVHFGGSRISGGIKAGHFRFRTVYLYFLHRKFFVTKYPERSDGDHAGNAFSCNFFHSMQSFLFPQAGNQSSIPFLPMTPLSK